MDEEKSVAYDIWMKTPVGIRLGYMTVCRNLDKVSGHLHILNHSNPFEGTIDAEGNCKLTGRMITLMRTINYEAAGRITPGDLELSIKDGRYVLEISGTPADCKKE